MWLVIGGGLILFREAHPEIRGTSTDSFALTGGSIGLFLSVYNFVRWWAARMMARHRARTESRPKRRDRGVTLEYLPEFDFNRDGPKTISDDE
jgi:hypothetical protein